MLFILASELVNVSLYAASEVSASLSLWIITSFPGHFLAMNIK